jgi:chromosome segregation ATPase
MTQTLPVPTIEAYDCTRVQRLLEELNRVTTFEEVNAWDRQAEDEIRRLKAYLDRLLAFERQIGVLEERAKQAHAQKTMVTRLWRSHDYRAEISTAREQISLQRSMLEKFEDALQAAVDKTPNSREERREMLQQLRLLKKELTQQRREINEAMRQIRTGARQRTAKVGSGLGLFLSTPASRRLSRMSIRLEKEAALAPNEDARAAIERQILIVDQAILWVERFR